MRTLLFDLQALCMDLPRKPEGSTCMSATDGRPAMPMSVLMSAHCSPWGHWANGDLRHKRILAHRALKKLQQDCRWKNGRSISGCKPSWGWDARQTHIGQFSEYMCEQVISLCQQAPVYASGRAA